MNKYLFENFILFINLLIYLFFFTKLLDPSATLYDQAIVKDNMQINIVLKKNTEWEEYNTTPDMPNISLE
jgi:hypothetical protein